MPVKPWAPRRVGALVFLLIAAITIVLMLVGSPSFWLMLGIAGLSLLAGAYVDLDVGARTRAVMAAAGITFTLLGLLPWLDLGRSFLA